MFTLVLNRVQKVGVPTLSGGYLLCGGAAALAIQSNCGVLKGACLA